MSAPTLLKDSTNKILVTDAATFEVLGYTLGFTAGHKLVKNGINNKIKVVDRGTDGFKVIGIDKT